MMHARQYLGGAGLTGALVMVLLVASGCASAPNAVSTPDDLDDEGDVGETPQVVVASIDPPIPAPGPELRLARVEFSRSSDAPLGAFIAVALTGDPGAVEILIRGLGEADTCEDASLAMAFLPRRLAPRPLWLALRLDCATEIARDVAPMLDLEHLVVSAREDDDLPSGANDDPGEDEGETSATEGRCDAVAASLRALSRGQDDEAAELDAIDTNVWAMPTSDEAICEPTAIAAAIRLHRQDRGVRLAFDLLLDTPGPLPEHLLSFINRYGLGGTTPRLAARHLEADGAVCAAMVRAGQLEPVLETLTDSPADVPLCLYPAVRELRDREDEAALLALDAIASTGPEAGCEAGALTAAIALVERGERSPRWTADATLLGRALGEALSRGAEWPTAAQLNHYRTAASRLHQRRDPPAQEGPVRLYQRDIRTVLDRTSGRRRSALRLLLEAGTR